jgi:hypothetical protein
MRLIFLPAAGLRNNNGTINYVGSGGYYWSSTAAASGAYYVDFGSPKVSPEASDNRVNGRSVRCLAEINTNHK